MPSSRHVLLVTVSLALCACASGNSEDGAAASTTAGSGSAGGGSDGGGGSGDGGGGPATGTTTSSSPTTSSSTGGDGGASTGSASGGGSSDSHLLISEIGAAPTTAEFVEIENPSDQAVSLGDVYLSDNSTYHRITAGQWQPISSNPGTDWLVRFPPGSAIAAGGRIWIAGRPDVEDTFGACPDFSWGDAMPCGAEAMVEPVAGAKPDLAEGVGHLSDSREMIILFRWSGDASAPVEDIDYVTWGALSDDTGARVNKTSVAGYAPETPRESQRAAPEANPESSISRCGGEVGETQSGGNGVEGHDETSEDLASAFTVTPRTPGAANACP